MGDRDCADLAPRLDRLDRGVVDERDHVPDHISVRRLGEEQPLGDREVGRDADAEIARVVADVAAMPRPQLLQAQPALAARPDVLALVVADRTSLRLAGVVRRAGAADPQGVSR